MASALTTILILLIAAVIGVALFRALRLPTMLAYFCIGLLIGPHTFGILPESEASRELAEFGVVFLMFSIGLEFSLPQLVAMRRIVFGLGGVQVTLTTVLVMAACLLLGMDWRAALVVAGALAMSSTALVSKMLVEQTELNSRHGRAAIGVLLFQDLAVVPLLIVIPALAAPAETMAWVLGLSAVKVAVVLAVLLVFGKRLINPWFNLVARQQSRELFVMNVLMVTLLIAWATHFAGLSYALGAFVAGMLISETRYRYQVEADIAPFRDILLGLFFITVGMLLDLQVLADNLGWLLLILLLIVAGKAVLIAQLARLFGLGTVVAIRTGILLAQAGEFGFVILAHGANNDLFAGVAMQLVLAAALLSMALTPFLIQRNDWFARVLSSRYSRNELRQVEEIERASAPLRDHVIICGFGRSGQALARFLRQEDVPFVALDIDPARVREAASAGENVIYGDAGRRAVLNAAGVARARAVVISYANLQAAMKVLHVMQEHYPQLPVIVRTMDDSNMEKFIHAGATEVVPEVLEGGLMLASHVLVLMGVPLSRVVKRIRQFREERYRLFRGFFHGTTDYDSATPESEQLRLRSVMLPAGAFACGKRLGDLALKQYRVEVKSIRRPGNAGMELKPDLKLQEGDMVMLQGVPVALAGAESYLLTGT